jgi:hypothetical protein
MKAKSRTDLARVYGSVDQIQQTQWMTLQKERVEGLTCRAAEGLVCFVKVTQRTTGTEKR